MRNMSFMLTTKQFRERTKTVTRRMGWGLLKPGDRVMGVEKGQGLKPGEKIVRLGEIEIVRVNPEPLSALYRYDQEHGGQNADCIREGFPELNASQFIAMFTRNMGGDENTIVNRIEFKYI